MAVERNLLLEKYHKPHFPKAALTVMASHLAEPSESPQCTYELQIGKSEGKLAQDSL